LLERRLVIRGDVRRDRVLHEHIARDRDAAEKEHTDRPAILTHGRAPTRAALRVAWCEMGSDVDRAGVERLVVGHDTIDGDRRVPGRVVIALPTGALVLERIPVAGAGGKCRARLLLELRKRPNMVVVSV